jgi:hypothetical protein
MDATQLRDGQSVIGAVLGDVIGSVHEGALRGEIIALAMRYGVPLVVTLP